jgi:hypothetical protein
MPKMYYRRYSSEYGNPARLSMPIREDSSTGFTGLL